MTAQKTIRTLSGTLLFLLMMQQSQAKIIFQAQFENGSLSEVDSKHADSPGTTTVINNPCKDVTNPTNKVVQYKTTGNSERAEIRAKGISKLEEYWYGWQIYIPENWKPAIRGSQGGGADIITQWHRGGSTPSWAKGHPMTLNISDDGSYNLSWNYGGPTRVEKGTKFSGINANTDKGKWINWAFHVKWAKETTPGGGFMRMYHNGELIFSDDGPNHENMNVWMMWKAGIYHGNPSDLQTDPYIILGDNYILGDSTSSLEEVNPYLNASAIDPSSQMNQPLEYGLGGNYPNPFNPSTLIPYSLSKAGNVKIDIYSIQGKWIASLMDGYVAELSGSVTWKPGTQLAGGIYVCQLIGQEMISSQKMLYIK